MDKSIYMKHTAKDWTGFTEKDLINVLDSGTKDLGLPIRVEKKVLNATLNAIWQVCVLSDDALRSVPGVGAKSVRQIREALHLIPGLTKGFRNKLGKAYWAWARKNGAHKLKWPGEKFRFVARNAAIWPEFEACVKRIQNGKKV